MLRIRPRSLAASSFVALLFGCSEAPSGPDVDALKAVAELYAQYAATHRGTPPANEAELKAFVAALEAEAMQPTEPGRKPRPSPRLDRYFASTRDGKPFVVKYGVPVEYAAGSTTVLAYEAEGVSGRRLVVYTNGTVAERTGDLP